MFKHTQNDYLILKSYLKRDVIMLQRTKTLFSKSRIRNWNLMVNWLETNNCDKLRSCNSLYLFSSLRSEAALHHYQNNYTWIKLSTRSICYQIHIQSLFSGIIWTVHETFNGQQSRTVEIPKDLHQKNIFNLLQKRKTG